MNILATGTVLEILKSEVMSYWKITGVRKFCGEDSYSVIRCSRNGKEYRDKNGYDVAWIHGQIAVGNIRVMGVVPEGLKANIEQGTIEGVRKRRIEYLKASIEAMQKELAGLEREA